MTSDDVTDGCAFSYSPCPSPREFSRASFRLKKIEGAGVGIRHHAAKKCLSPPFRGTRDSVFSIEPLTPYVSRILDCTA